MQGPNESFFALTEEKQNHIVNAAMGVFARSSYTKASTDEMAALAGISKGLLFYHFKNKQTLYRYLYFKCCRQMRKDIENSGALEEPDFFDRHQKIMKARIASVTRHPHLFDFMARAYYETEAVPAQSVASVNEAILAETLHLLQHGIDLSGFTDPSQADTALKMLLWVGDGYMRERIAENGFDPSQAEIDLSALLDILKRGFYK